MTWLFMKLREELGLLWFGCTALIYSSMRKVARAWTETFRSEVRKKLWDTLTGWGQWWADCKLSLHGNGSYIKYCSWLKHYKIFHTPIATEALSQNNHFLSFLIWRKLLIFFPAQLGGRFPTIFSPQGGTGKQLFRKQAPTESANSARAFAFVRYGPAWPDLP